MDKPRITATSPFKSLGKNIFLLFVVILMIFPFINTFNELLVRIIEPFLFSSFNKDILIPYEARLVKVLLGFLSIPVAYSTPDSEIITLVGKTGGLEPIAIAWNCLGWQSMVLIIASLIVGMRGKFTWISKSEMIIIGIFITFWINIFRIVAIFYLYYNHNRSIAMVFHDYGGMIITIAWLFFFWWFSFKFVLVPKDTDSLIIKRKIWDQNRPN